MKLAALQVAGSPGDVTRRVGELLPRSEADVAVLPERPLGDEVPRFDGGFIGDLLRATAGSDSVLVGPAAERDGRVVAPVMQRGEVLATPEKMHLYREEKDRFEPGGLPVAVDTPAGRLGVAICYDATFPEYVRALCLDGAEAVLVPAGIPRDGVGNWETYLRARALENKVPVAAANEPDVGGGRVLWFRRGARSPSVMEEVLAEECAAADVDTAWAAELREERLAENRMIRRAGAVR